MKSLSYTLLVVAVMFVLFSCKKDGQKNTSLPGPMVADSANSPLSLPELYEIAIEQVFKLKEHELTEDSIHSIATLLSQDKTDEYNQIRARILSSWYFFGKWEVDTARLLVQENLTFFKDNPRYGEHLDYGRSLYNLAKISIRSDELRLAKLYIQDALQVFEATGHQIYISNTLTNLGAVEYLTANYPAALENYLRAYHIKEEMGLSPEMTSTDLYNISLVLNKMGEYQKQLSYAFDLLRIAEESSNIGSQMLVLNSLGNVYSEKLGNLDSALYYYKRCQEVALANNNINRYYLAELNMVSMYSTYKHFEVSNQLAWGIINGGDEVPAWVKEDTKAFMAENYLQLGKLDSCILMGTQAFQYSVYKGSMDEVIQRSEILWKAYERMGKYDSAFHYLNVNQQQSDSIYNVENQRKLSSLYAELETIEKQKEIEILLGEKKLQEAKTLNLTMALTSGGIITFLIFLTSVLAYRNREKQHKLHKYELQTEIEQKMKDLNQQSLKIIQKDKNLSEIEEGLKKIKSKMINGSQLELQQILNTIRVNKSLEKEWEKFDEYFGNANNSFYDRMSERFPDLTISEKRLASLIKMNLTNREIANIMNIEDKSVRMAKYRLKKKLNLSDDQSVNTFLADL